MDTSEKVACYFAEEHQYKEAIDQLRDLALKTGLEETFKWTFATYIQYSQSVGQFKCIT